jgi:hypothetical protein
METQIRERPPCAAQLARCTLGNVEKVAFIEKMLLPIDLQKPFTVQNYACYVNLSVDV